MTTRTVSVICDEVEYILEDDATPYLSMEDDEDYGSLTFYDNYRKPRDEDGYSPPKYLAIDGVLYGIVAQVLEEMGRNDLELVELDTTDDFEMETFHVFPQILHQIKKRELSGYKMTRYDVRVWKKNRGNSSSSSSSSSDEEDEKVGKKRKLDESKIQ